MTAPYDPYNNVSYLDINRRKWGDYDREDGDRLENRAQQPLIKKLYLKRNGDEPSKKPKLFIWRQRQVPSLRHLLDDLGIFLGMQDTAENLYDVHGHKISNESEIRDRSVYYVTGDEPLMFHKDNSRRAGTPQGYRNEARHSSMSAPELESFSRNSLYADLKANTPPPRPHSAQLPKRKHRKVKTLSKNREVDEFERYYRAAAKTAKSRRADDYDYRGTGRYNSRVPELVESRARTSYDRRYREPSRQEDHYRSRSANDDFDSDQFRSDFHDEGWEERDKYALEKHKEKNSFRQRSNSGVIYHRRDQTNPEAYLIYVFLNGQGMESQHVNFQKKQLEKGMNYILELVARRYSVNPGRLCDMDGRRIHNVSDLMSRGAYVLVPVGQTFRDTWYFLPDNAIDTRTHASAATVTVSTIEVPKGIVFFKEGSAEMLRSIRPAGCYQPDELSSKYYIGEISRIGESHPTSYSLIPPHGETSPSAPPFEFQEEYSGTTAKFKYIKKYIAIRNVTSILLGIYILELGCSATFHKRDDWLFRCLSIFGKGYDYSDSSFWIVLYFFLKGCCIASAVIGMFLSLPKIKNYLRVSRPQKYFMLPMMLYLTFWILFQVVIILYIIIIINKNGLSEADEQRLLISLGLTDSRSLEKISRATGIVTIPFVLFAGLDIFVVVILSVQLYRMCQCPSF